MPDYHGNGDVVDFICFLLHFKPLKNAQRNGGKMIKILSFLAVVCIVFAGCSREDRSEAIDRVSEAAKKLNGNDKAPEQEQSVPLIVQEQQRKERIRQNTEWTAENQRLHPIEYCQAQLSELDKYGEKLEVSAHTLAVELNKVRRNMGNDEAQLKQLQEFLATAKKAYLEAEAAGQWPVNINGFALSQENAKLKIVEAAKKIKELESGGGMPKNQEAMLQKKLEKIQAEQQRVVKLREKVQRTINDIRTQIVIDGNNGIVDALNAINDSIGALSVGDDAVPSLEDLSKPTSQANIDQEFDAIIRN